MEIKVSISWSKIKEPNRKRKSLTDTDLKSWKNNHKTNSNYKDVKFKLTNLHKISIRKNLKLWSKEKMIKKQWRNCRKNYIQSKWLYKILYKIIPISCKRMLIDTNKIEWSLNKSSFFCLHKKNTVSHILARRVKKKRKKLQWWQTISKEQELI